MHALSYLSPFLILLRRRDEAQGGGVGCFVVLMVIGIVLFLILKGRADRKENLGAANRPLGSGPVEGHVFANPYTKCPTCGAGGDKMKQKWDGLRSITWTCGYCGNPTVQQLTDEELPPSIRQRMGLDAPQGAGIGQPGPYYPQQGGMGGMGGLLTGMMIGNMLGGSHGHSSDQSGWGGDGDGGQGGWGGESDSTGGDWGDSGDSGGDWGDSGGGDF